MPQLNPLFFLSQILSVFTGIALLVYVLGLYLLPKHLNLLITRIYFRNL